MRAKYEGRPVVRSFEDVIGVSDICIDQDDDIVTEIRSVLDQCPGELRSRRLALTSDDNSESRQKRSQRHRFDLE